jgi:redox-sensitive bicupin YhaK (pirin superfamily)
MENLILQTIAPVTHDLGGFKVHRTLPSRPRTMVGPFIFFDQMGPARFPAGQGIDVRPHPHINLSTVTYLFEGSLDHRDSLGTYARIEPGAASSIRSGAARMCEPMRPLCPASRLGSRCPMARRRSIPPSSMSRAMTCR